MTSVPTVSRGEPLLVVRTCLERLERAAIKAGDHPIVIHCGLEALERVDARIKELEEALRPLLDGLVVGGCIICQGLEEHHPDCLVGFAERALAGEEKNDG